MVVCTLESPWEILRRYLENHANVTECVGKLWSDIGREVPSALYVNKQNFRFWKAEALFWFWFWSRGIIGFFFLPKWERPFRTNFYFTKIEEDGIGSISFQQDGATCHTNFFSQKLKRMILGAFDFSRMALRDTHLEIYSVSCGLSLIISCRAVFDWPL